MRDLFIISFIIFVIGCAIRRPWLMTLGYIYVDLASPQRVGYYLLSALPLSLIFAVAAVVFFFLFDPKRRIAFSAVQVLMTITLIWVTITTFMAVVPEFAWTKWHWAWKSIAFSIFLPFVLSSRTRIEGALLVMVLSVATLTINGGIKTLLGGGGYGTLRLFISANNGLFEGSTLATVAIALIPLILYLYNHSPLIKRDLITKLLTAGLIFASVLIPIGTEARTGLVCLVALAGMLFLHARRKLMLAVAALAVGAAVLPLLPASYTGRMSTIESHDEDASATTRLAVWKWTLGFVAEHPFGGGFDAYRINQVQFELVKREGDANSSREVRRVVTDQARAFHSSYFEMLGEHGYLGLVLFLSMNGITLLQLRSQIKRFSRAEPEDRWVAELARALARSLIVMLVGSLFVGIAFQTFLYMLLAVSTSLVGLAAHFNARKNAERRWPAPLAPPAVKQTSP